MPRKQTHVPVTLKYVSQVEHCDHLQPELSVIDFGRLCNNSVNDFAKVSRYCTAQAHQEKHADDGILNNREPVVYFSRKSTLSVQIRGLLKRQKSSIDNALMGRVAKVKVKSWLDSLL